MKKLLVFDLDNTLINGDSSNRWNAYMIKHGIIEDGETFLKEERRFIDLYNAGMLNIADYVRFYTEPVVNMTVEEVRSKVQDYIREDLIFRLLPQAAQLFMRCRALNYGVVILSATSETVVLPFAEALGIEEDHALCVRLKRSADNKHYSPEIEGTATFREGKIQVLKEWLKQHPEYDPAFSFYSDSINDLPMLEQAAHPFAVNPDRKLREEAEKRGWPVLEWKKEAALLSAL